ncbi:MAG: YicC family protein [Candidatus Competibacteraceae bacterium]|nr:YicC family protein [Candidatus Competibacteraceae bacterium]MBK7983835.1 YicC family protein [Candidatus Competibacteraceae bacterium]MBK8897624.1 YicC family protein [Candidatus Competibacteraceae bacterium]MBK8963768.1 YicC family protein [Candidatus Competibacteraceae bacterium]MBK9950660.1 YicC family protein [Candidatus Competibacteraceae bacterium]
MLRSMTAFARQEQASTWGTMIWELRSVNHRYLETTVRLPEALRGLESLVRERIAAALGRGKVECNLKLQTTGAGLTAITLNHSLVARLLEIAGEVEHMIGPGTGLKLGDVLRWPGVVNEVEPDLDDIKQALLGCLDAALAELIATREREGQRTADLLQQRCEAIRTQVQRVRARRPEVQARWRDKLSSRLADIPTEADPGRLEQELALIAQRLDVDEELDRLDAHLDEIQDVFARPEPVGRRLDFLMQELNREANTLSSKSADTDTTRAAVELKVLIEQMREQVQNIE